MRRGGAARSPGRIALVRGRRLYKGAVDSPAHLGTLGAGKEGGDPSNPAPTAGLTSPLPILLAGHGEQGEEE